MSDDEKTKTDKPEKADKPQKPAKEVKTDKADLPDERVVALEARVSELEKQMEVVVAKLPAKPLSTSEVKAALEANPYQHFQVLEACRTQAGVLHKGHVFRADQMSSLASMVSAHGLQITAVER